MVIMSVNIVTHVHVMMGNSVMSQAMIVHYYGRRYLKGRSLSLYCYLNCKHGTWNRSRN